jgi:carboxymethylenebutenolidase
MTDKTEAEWKRGFQLYQGFNEAKGVQDLIASLDHLRKLPNCNGKAGSVGYCLGGKLAYLMATRSNADANVSYYGGGIDNLLTEASAITKPLLLHLAGDDEYMQKDAQDKIRDAVARNSAVSLHVYPGCGHAFARVGGGALERSRRQAGQRAHGGVFQETPLLVRIGNRHAKSPRHPFQSYRRP